MIAIKGILFFSGLFLFTSISFAGLRRTDGNDSCLKAIKPVLGQDSVASYDYTAKQVYISVASKPGEFRIYGPLGENIVNGRNCLGGSKITSTQFVERSLDNSISDLLDRKPHYGFLGELRGNPALWNEQRSELLGVLSECEKSSIFKETAKTLKNKYFPDEKSVTTTDTIQKAAQ
jgi:hypothetical protein